MVVRQHATLAGGGHVAPSGSVVDVPSDRVGAFIYRSSSGYGTFTANGVGLQWDHVPDGVAAGASVEVRPFGIEMVYVPQESFSLGSDGVGERGDDHGDADAIGRERGVRERLGGAGPLAGGFVRGSGPFAAGCGSGILRRPGTERESLGASCDGGQCRGARIHGCARRWDARRGRERERGVVAWVECRRRRVPWRQLVLLLR